MTRITEYHLVEALGRRVPFEGCVNVGFEERPHLRQGGGKPACDLVCPLRGIVAALVILPRFKPKFAARLFL